MPSLVTDRRPACLPSDWRVQGVSVSDPLIGSRCIQSQRAERYQRCAPDLQNRIQEDEKKRKQQKKRTRQMSRAWLKEGEGDEPLNFLDANAAQRVLATKQSHDFRVTSDGRLIMEDGEAEEEENSQGVDEEMADLMKEVGLRTLAAQEYTDPFTKSQTLERRTN
ncbi:RRP12-like protein isoform X4 [Aquarana catesbeiana]|uniref:RRP12-like protein isoform X4 n=1 Tax=Aquarana catesbeiana TaxID=8400 RepID=UPI003CC97E22